MIKTTEIMKGLQEYLKSKGFDLQVPIYIGSDSSIIAKMRPGIHIQCLKYRNYSFDLLIHYVVNINVQGIIYSIEDELQLRNLADSIVNHFIEDSYTICIKNREFSISDIDVTISVENSFGQITIKIFLREKE